MDHSEFTRQHMILNYDDRIEKQKIYSNSLIITLINSLFFFLFVYFVNLINIFFILDRIVPLLVGLYSDNFSNIFYAYI